MRGWDKYSLGFAQQRSHFPLGKALYVMLDNRAFKKLTDYLNRIPAVTGKVSFASEEDNTWWVKLTIDINHHLAWATVQELGHVLNYLSLNERLPTSFHPVSPPPYMNGGPEDFLSWVIECSDGTMRPGTVSEWLEGRLPRPVEDESKWDEE